MRSGGGSSNPIKVLRSANPKCVEVHYGGRLALFFDKGVATPHPQNPTTLVVRQGSTIIGYIYEYDVIVDQ